MINDRYKCIIIDDEPKAIELLTDSLHIINKAIDIIAVYTTWEDALTAIRSVDCDIIFLDISIQGKNGMDLLRYSPNISSEIIFVTAYSDFALTAFRFPVSGYILKPVDEIELSATVDRAIGRIRNKRLAQQNSHPVLQTRIGIPDNKSINYVTIKNILYLEAFNSYTRVITCDQDILSAYNIGKFKELLPADTFYQIHRSFIINLDHVSRYENIGNVVLDNGKELPVSKAARAALLAHFSQIKISKDMHH